ncbi:hypothetical protein [Streptomyces sp. OE57]|uniref:hypothetical protein n=1 Tax=Streptomyces lacaronensis TaxID=3379885 RepID=UPI0039B768E4
MPVEFLTDEQAEAYGRFVEEPTRPEPERFFYLDDARTPPSTICAPRPPVSGSMRLWTRTSFASPLRHANLNCLGRYSFRAAVPVGGGLRPLRDPATGDADEDGEQM